MHACSATLQRLSTVPTSHGTGAPVPSSRLNKEVPYFMISLHALAWVAWTLLQLLWEVMAAFLVYWWPGRVSRPGPC